ncbi:pyrroloquinoline quinone biosynthesis protein PqqB [Rhodovastum atsumiense]|uniref:Coenzyme PQQ synthesis protein B n=1 Tax=Rhodovastum atsumiense TaxID=504468 RepID=A0A5M6IRL9_9PROT|nr:pyrroloquinoline quinone biosynthesis protein PqqB [Rhodovastum atsumiense]
MTALVLGAAAGGGFPQWNCACRLCCLARAGDARVRPATQAGMAVTANGRNWVLIGASPDLRQQLTATPSLAPRGDGRDTPITAVLLISADIDGIAGLLTLRESQAFDIYAPPAILEVLGSNRVFDVLDPSLVRRIPLPPHTSVACAGITMTVLPMPGKVPLYLEDRQASQPEPGPTYAVRLDAAGRRIVVAPACAEITGPVRAALRDTDALFFDGTLFTDDEMISAGVGVKTGQRMGHVCIDGEAGSLSRLRDLPGRRIFYHINNTNPILLADSPERRMAEAAGFEIAYDGMQVQI